MKVLNSGRTGPLMDKNRAETMPDTISMSYVTLCIKIHCVFCKNTVW